MNALQIKSFLSSLPFSLQEELGMVEKEGVNSEIEYVKTCSLCGSAKQCSVSKIISFEEDALCLRFSTYCESNDTIYPGVVVVAIPLGTIFALPHEMLRVLKEAVNLQPHGES